jgi:hypothetical protein
MVLGSKNEEGDDGQAQCGGGGMSGGGGGGVQVESVQQVVVGALLMAVK